MKKLILALAILLVSTISSTVNAEPIDLKGKLPAFNQGIAYSVVDSNFNYLGTLDVATWKAFTFEAGYAGQFNTDSPENTGNKLVGVLSVKLLDLGNVIQFPILDKVVFRPSIWFGVGNIGKTDLDSSETDWGIGLSCISFKF